MDQPTTYRPDIDGLRAIAVTAVIFFHLPANWLEYGYLGVDIFFVISGYLITSILHRELRNGTFSLKQFYARRIKRLLPALGTVIVVTTAISLVILLPADLLGYARSVLATLVFSANIYFWRDTNYFARDAEEKPLLHLWSLGVEEQFYLIFPILLLFLARFSPVITLTLVVLMSGISLAINILLVSIGGSSPAFFLIPARAWELGLGATIALLPVSSALSSKGLIIKLLAAFGLLLALLSLVYGNYSLAAVPTPFFAVLGSALFIWAGTDRKQQSPVSVFLSTRPIVAIGKISYSLYLWHWPIIVLSQYYLVRHLSAAESAISIVTMFIAATLTYRYIENPLRKSKTGLRTTAKISSVVCIGFASIALIILNMDGLPGRLNPAAAKINSAVGTNYRCPISSYTQFGGSRACRLNFTGNINQTEIVLFGNSHAQMYAPLIKSIADDANLKLLLVPMNSCLPTVELNLSLACTQMARQNQAEILSLPSLKAVVIGTTWFNNNLVTNDNVVEKDSRTAQLKALKSLVTEFESNGQNVGLIGPLPTPGVDIASALSRNMAFNRDHEIITTIPTRKFTERLGNIAHILDQNSGLQLIPVHNAICNATDCSYVINNESIFADSNHVAEAALDRFKPYFSDFSNCLTAEAIKQDCSLIK